MNERKRKTAVTPVFKLKTVSSYPLFGQSTNWVTRAQIEKSPVLFRPLFSYNPRLF